MLEPLGVAIHAFNLAKVQTIDTVAILGTGPIGIMLVQLLKLHGASNIISIDPVPYRELAGAVAGADHTAPHVAAVKELTNGRGVDLVIEATNSPRGLMDACEAVRIGGRMVIVGIPDGNEYSHVLADLMRRKGIDLRMSRRMGDTMHRAIDLVANAQVEVEATATHRFQLEDAAVAFEMMSRHEDGIMKGVVDVAGAPSS